MATNKDIQKDLPDISKLDLNSKKISESKKKRETKVVDSWEDDVEDEHEEQGTDKPESDSLPNEEFDQKEPVESAADTSYLGEASPFYSSQRDESMRSSTPRERPATSMLVANRLIASGTGHRIKRTEEQRKADKEKFDREKKRKEEERKAKAEAEKARKSVWEDD